MSAASIKPIIAICPGCDTRIRFDERPRLNEIVTCPECEGSFEVVRLRPLELDWAYDAAYDDEAWADEVDEEYVNDIDDYDFDEDLLDDDFDEEELDDAW